MRFQNILWYNLPIDHVLKELDSSEIGLTEKDAKVRVQEFGVNELPRKSRVTGLAIFLRQFKSALVYILVVAAGFTLILSEFVDFFIILVAILVNVLVGYIQESKAEKGLEKLQEFISYQAKVYREGVLQRINATELVPGDLVLLEAGDQVPADIRLIEVNNLSASEAVLTGESNPVTKTTEIISRESNKQVLVADRRNMVYKGTLIGDGKATGVVVATGKDTELGKIASLLEKTEEDQTPLQHKLGVFSRRLGLIISGLALLLLVVGLLKGLPFREMFFLSIAVAVAAVPEGLLMAVTVILSIGMQRILKKRALVRRLLAAETLGSTTVICVDKTGTITEGKMMVDRMVGYSTKASIKDSEDKLMAFEKMMQTTLLCNNAVFENGEMNGNKIIGSPTEKALLQSSLHFRKEAQNYTEYRRLHEVPFNSRAKLMYTLNAKHGEYLWCVKGAPEVVLDNCAYYEENGDRHELTAEKRSQWQKQFNEYSNKGYRLLATAYKDTKVKDFNSYKKEGFTILGFWVLVDPIRPEIRNTIDIARQAGIQTVMITGDHVLTAKEIARKIGLPVEAENVINGEELIDISDKDLQQKVKGVTVFARVTPQDKLRIVNAFQANHEVVAMTGDGVNDAPALKTADIGIAVGAGTDVTKQTADLVLLDNNFKTIVSAIEQGRIIFANIKKVIVYLLADSFSELLLIIASLFIGLPLPVTAAQILWINLVSHSLPAAALTVEQSEPGIMQQKPISKHMNILDKEMKVLIFVIGIVTDFFLLFIYIWLFNTGLDLDYVRTFMFAALGLDSLFYVFSCRSLRQPIWRMNIFTNKYLLWAVIFGICLLVLPIYLPLLQEIFNMVPLGFSAWGVVICFSIIKVFLIEMTKILFYPKVKKYEAT